MLSHCRHWGYWNTIRKNIVMQVIPRNYKIIFKNCWVGSESLSACINQLASRNMFLNQSSIFLLKLSRVGCSFFIRICFWIIQLWMYVFISSSDKSRSYIFWHSLDCNSLSSFTSKRRRSSCLLFLDNSLYCLKTSSKRVSSCSYNASVLSLVLLNPSAFFDFFS